MTQEKDKVQTVDETSNAVLGNTLKNLKKLVIEFTGKGKNILFTGDPGVGKELFANLYAAACSRPILPINMTGIPSGLIESTLFGYVKGAFPGAFKNTDGIITKNKGTTHCFFLDELGDMPAITQAKLLRFIQFGEIQKVGSAVTEKIESSELRVVAASNKPECIRDDLKDRFKCFRIPRLIERIKDIPILMEHFLKGSSVKGITEYTLQGLSEIVLDDYDYGHMHPWKGNVRELKKVIEDAIFLCRKRQNGILASEDFPSVFWAHEWPGPYEREQFSSEIPQILEVYDRLYMPGLPHSDNSKTIKIKDLSSESEPLPYHYFLKSPPSEVSKEDWFNEEFRRLRFDLRSIGETMSSINNKIPIPKPPQTNQITFMNYIPQKFEDEFYEFHAKMKTPIFKIVDGYKKQGGSISRNTVSKKISEAEERLKVT